MQSPGPLPVILDVDTGVDDALAILLALRSPALQVLGITCVTGNVPVGQVVRNTRRVLSALGDPCTPVLRGAERPLRESPHYSVTVHGPDGLGGLDLPDPEGAPREGKAVDWLRDTLMAAAEPVLILALGPATNLAALLEAAPEVKPKIRRIMMMGGAFAAPGNAGPVAEYNIRVDPEAAQQLFSSGAPLTLYTLDVFRAVAVRREQLARLEASGAAGDLAAQLLAYMMDRFNSDQTSIGDAGVVASAILPEALHTERYAVQVELEGRLTRGQTVVDRRTPLVKMLNAYWGEAAPPNLEVSVSVDGDRLSELFSATIEGKL